MPLFIGKQGISSFHISYHHLWLYLIRSPECRSSKSVVLHCKNYHYNKYVDSAKLKLMKKIVTCNLTRFENICKILSSKAFCIPYKLKAIASNSSRCVKVYTENSFMYNHGIHNRKSTCRKCIMKYNNPSNPSYLHSFVLHPFVWSSFVLRSYVLHAFVTTPFCPALFWQCAFVLCTSVTSLE